MTKRKTQGEKQGRQTDKDGYKSKKKIVPARKRPKSALLEPDTGKSQPMIAQAITQGWITKDGQRWETDMTIQELQRRQKRGGLNAKDRVMLAVLNGLSGDTAQQAVSNFLRMEAQNQRDEHFVIQLATPELHVHGHKHELIGSDDPELVAVIEAIDFELTKQGIDPELSSEVVSS